MPQSTIRKLLRYALPHGVIQFVRDRRTLTSLGKHVSPADFLRTEDLVYAAEESGVALLPKTYGQKIRHVIDVGANVGQWSGMVFEVLSPETLTLVEPIPGNIAKLKQLYAGNPRVRYQQVAVGAEPGTVKFKVTRDTTGASVLPPAESMRGHVENNWDVIEEIEIPLVTIDQIAADLPEVSLLKVDVQGYELPAFKGAVQSFAKTRWIIVELNHVKQYEGGSTFGEVHDFLVANGFFLCNLSKPLRFGEHAIMSDGLYGNARLLPELQR